MTSDREPIEFWEQVKQWSVGPTSWEEAADKLAAALTDERERVRPVKALLRDGTIFGLTPEECRGLLARLEK